MSVASSHYPCDRSISADLLAYPFLQRHLRKSGVELRCRCRLNFGDQQGKVVFYTGALLSERKTKNEC